MIIEDGRVSITNILPFISCSIRLIRNFEWCYVIVETTNYRSDMSWNPIWIDPWMMSAIYRSLINKLLPKMSNILNFFLLQVICCIWQCVSALSCYFSCVHEIVFDYWQFIYFSLVCS